VLGLDDPFQSFPTQTIPGFSDRPCWKRSHSVYAGIIGSLKQDLCLHACQVKTERDEEELTFSPLSLLQAAVSVF